MGLKLKFEQARELRVIRYLAAATASILAGILSLVLPWPLAASPLFALAVVGSAWFGGLGPAICSSLLCALFWQAAVMSETGRLNRPVLAESGVLLLSALVIGRLVAQLRRRDQDAIRRQQEMEQLVLERNSESQRKAEFWEGLCFSIAHDLRAPLRAMHGYGTALAKQAFPTLNDPRRDYVRRICRATEQMDRLVEALLDYGRLSQSACQPGPTDLNVETDAVLAKINGDILARQAEITVERPMPKALANPALIQEILTNLLSNALKFVAPGIKPKIRIRAETNHSHVRLWVSDNGIGIDPAHHQKIFQVFHRVHRNGDFPGTGIGLAMVQKAAELLGGCAGVLSAPGQGSRFWVDLPKV